MRLVMNDRIEKLKTFLQQSPDDCFLNHALALEYIKLDDDAQALAVFEKNLLHDPAYVATYYHMGKLLERNGDTNRAIAIYEQGMEKAKAVKDMHSYNELQNAYEDLVY